jgi:hypothetical protein
MASIIDEKWESLSAENFEPVSLLHTVDAAGD